MTDRKLVVYEADPNEPEKFRLRAIDANGSGIPITSMRPVTVLPASGTVAGEAVVIQASNDCYAWNGVNWMPLTGGATVRIADTAPANPVDGQLWYQKGTSQKILHGLRVWDDADKRWISALPDRIIELGDGQNQTNLPLKDTWLYNVTDVSDPTKMPPPIKEKLYGQFTGKLEITNTTGGAVPRTYSAWSTGDFVQQRQHIANGGASDTLVWEATPNINIGEAHFTGELILMPCPQLSALVQVLNLEIWGTDKNQEHHFFKCMIRTTSGHAALSIGTTSGRMQYLVMEGGARFNSDTPLAGDIP